MRRTNQPVTFSHRRIGMLWLLSVAMLALSLNPAVAREFIWLGNPGQPNPVSDPTLGSPVDWATGANDPGNPGTIIATQWHDLSTGRRALVLPESTDDIIILANRAALFLAMIFLSLTEQSLRG
ncbi:MAG: hypothetical protein AAF417_19360 [Pseudomonadota bacterium]